MGSQVAATQLAMLEGVAKGFAAKYGENAADAATIAAQWLTVEGRSELFKELGDIEVLKPAIEAATPISQEFDRSKLMPMYRRVAAAIREVDGNHLLFMEPNLFANTGVMPALDLVIGGDGVPDPQLALAPHAYDMVTDTKDVSLASDARVAFIFDRLAEHGQSMGLPSLVGEWGAYYGQKDTLGVALFVVRQFEKHLLSDTYWDFHRGIDRAPYFPALARPYPVAVAGTLVRYESNHNERSFACTWEEDPSVVAPTVVYMPGAWYPDQEPQIRVEPECDVSVIPVEGTQSRFLHIAPGKGALERTLTLTRRGLLHDTLGHPAQVGDV
jgi:endoglycosylceramidase